MIQGRATRGMLVGSVAWVCGCSAAHGTSAWEVDPSESTSQLIGSSGGEIVSPAGAQVSFPEGALSDPTPVMVATAFEGYLDRPNGVDVRSPIFSVTPHGLELAKPVRIRLPFNPQLGSAVTVYTSEPSSHWVKLTATSVANGFATVSVEHFSYFFVGSKSATVTTDTPAKADTQGVDDRGVTEEGTNVP